MIFLVLGTGIGIYIGTYYKCKPVLDYIVQSVKDMCPERNHEEEEEEEKEKD